MILADTSVWIDHFRSGVAELATLLERGELVIHPFIVGELACGNLADRDEPLELLQQLRSITVAEHQEIVDYIATRRLHGLGIGYIDVHLLAATAIDGCLLWTKDKRLHTVAAELGLSA